MEATQLISLTVLAGLSMYYLIRRIKADEKREKDHKILMEYERIQQVKHFRQRLIHEFDCKIVRFMPTHNEMLNSNKPLIAKEWVNVDQLVNLN